MLISLIVPCYNEEEAMPLFYQEASRVAAQMEKSHGAQFEFVFIDDGSRDGTLRVARELHAQDPRVRYVSFSRNFGKEAGIYAGLQAARGDYVATMDADLQDPPSLLPDMLDTLLTGEYDCAATRRTTRKGEPPLRSWFAKKFYQIINKMSDTEIVDGARDFRLMSRKMVDAVLRMAEYNRFSKGIFSWVGFKTKWFDYENIERVAGTTKWNFWGLFKYSIEGIVGFSTTPLLVAAGAGVLFCRHPGAGLRRSHFRLAQHGVHHPAVQRRAAFLHRHRGRIPCQDLPGSQAPPHLHRRRDGGRQINGTGRENSRTKSVGLFGPDRRLVLSKPLGAADRHGSSHDSVLSGLCLRS